MDILHPVAIETGGTWNGLLSSSRKSADGPLQRAYTVAFLNMFDSD